jgi:hypothetical protein
LWVLFFGMSSVLFVCARRACGSVHRRTPPTVSVVRSAGLTG